MKQLVIGILAHVDAGKTTLSEALLYTAGAIPALGRVDHRDAYLDTHALERDRGITIFSKQALFQTPELAVTLLDTPGHVDFSAEMERTLQVLDYAILVISATDGVQAHTETLWRLLRRNQIPTFLFVTKMDLPNPGRGGYPGRAPAAAGRGVRRLHPPGRGLGRGVALRDEGLLDRYLETGRLTPGTCQGWSAWAGSSPATSARPSGWRGWRTFSRA
ncbi:MAG: GTP-binding protein [Evtepia gabavorous]